MDKVSIEREELLSLVCSLCVETLDLSFQTFNGVRGSLFVQSCLRLCITQLYFKSRDFLIKLRLLRLNFNLFLVGFANAFLEIFNFGLKLFDVQVRRIFKRDFLL